ncbi:MAG: UDP-N-acetylmuramoyl-L-alanyl-D-glutamate--2,6-diaminopimelate ligase [Nitriliruptoraceae bacterium]
MTMRLSDIVARVSDASLRGGDCTVHDVVHRHDEVTPGVMFAAVTGAQHDGHDFVQEAIARGAAAILTDRPLDAPIPQLMVRDVRQQMGIIASHVHANPSGDLILFGVTGTNGKTTVTAFLEAACAANGWGTGVIGTVATRIHGDSEPGVRTTPEATDLQRLFRLMYTRGVDAVAMEVSSHGLALNRVDGTTFATVLFTNLSQDHLDFHGSMEAYYQAKRRLFSEKFARHGVVFVDDQWTKRLVHDAEIPVVRVGFSGEDVDVSCQITGTSTAHLVGTLPNGDILDEHVTVSIPGRHNLANAALAVVAVVLNGVPADVACDGIAHAPGVPGRLELVALENNVRAYVDFAHTPEAIRAVIAAGRSLLEKNGRLILVVGCGGERDQAKRGLMGLAATLADIAILTSDNPRSEDPQAILDAIHAGAIAAVFEGAVCDVHVEVDRRTAISRAVEMAKPNDIIIVAGKGHETTQIFADRTVAFDDREVIKDADASLKGR